VERKHGLSHVDLGLRYIRQEIDDHPSNQHEFSSDNEDKGLKRLRLARALRFQYNLTCSPYTAAIMRTEIRGKPVCPVETTTMRYTNYRSWVSCHAFKNESETYVYNSCRKDLSGP
jgi:hypothetical protein